VIFPLNRAVRGKKSTLKLRNYSSAEGARTDISGVGLITVQQVHYGD
jgi:hypothetical protein